MYTKTPVWSAFLFITATLPNAGLTRTLARRDTFDRRASGMTVLAFVLMHGNLFTFLAIGLFLFGASLLYALLKKAQHKRK